MNCRRIFRNLRRPLSTRLNLEQFENRIQPTVYLVHTGSDNGSNASPIPGSLREAISYVNGGLHDEIQFDMFFTPGATKISLVAPLLPLTKTCKIGGGTMPGMLPMEINGSALGMGSGITFTAGGSLKGVAITGFPEFGVNVIGGSVTIESVTIGTNLAGTMPIANKGGGIALATSGNSVKSSLISANGKDGIMIVGPGGNLITGNTIGLNLAGTMPFANFASGIKIDNSPGNMIGGVGSLGNTIAGNAAHGIQILGAASKSTIIKGNTIGNSLVGNTGDGILVVDAPSTIIGGKAVGEGNIVSNNKTSGIELMAAGGLTSADPGALIEGNFIGTNAAGTADLGNKFDGIRVAGLHNNIIGGDMAGAGNLISGNDAVGVNIGAGNKNTVRGNKIGLNATGMAAIPNTVAGVAIASATNTIGGDTAAARNIISGNTGVGVILSGVAAMDNIVSGNWVGLAADGTSALGNKSYGFLVNGNASKNTIGGKTVAEGNTIVFNGESVGMKGLKGHGIAVTSGTSNAIRRNSIFDNFGRGIDLGDGVNADGVTLNDPGGDADTGANGLQDYPFVISRPAGVTGNATWELNSTPNTSFILEFYSNDTIDPSGFGEGKMFLGDATVTTNAFGTVRYDSAFGGMLVSATATDPMGNTSEFSMIDSDADALADAWETTGIDSNEDGVVDLVLSGASPTHKDLFVEFDAMVGRAPSQTTLNNLVASFAAAPNSLVHNPNGADGVTLHLSDLSGPDVTDLAIAATPFGTNYWKAFDDVKAVNFGTSAQRTGGNWANIKPALDWTHRYCIFAQSYNNGTSSGIAEEIGSNDFMVTLPAGTWGANTNNDRAGTFMHELGHTLELRHGGFENTNFKPNYVSIMNYSWQFPNAIQRIYSPAMPDYASSWKLDYSREKLAPLDENHLNETIGLGGATGKAVPYGQGDNLGFITAAFLGPQTGAIDWNGGGSANGTDVKSDINFDNKTTTLDGQEDWSKLRFYFIESASYAEGKHNDSELVEIDGKVAPPRVAQVTINNGDAQRSRVTSVAMTFDQHITQSFSLADAFAITRQGDSKQPNLTTSVNDSGATTVVTLTFIGTTAVESGSLADGRYTLTIDATKVYNANGMLDGDGDGTGGDNYTLASAATPNPPTNIYRIFGDADGDGTISTADFIQFRLAFGGTSNAFDFDNDGSVSASDFIQFRLRFGGSI